MRALIRLIWVLVAIAASGCAKRGSISGGAKDTLAPVLESSVPKNYSTGFKGNEIRLNFNEYVKLKDVEKNLIVSPPMKTPPVISPTTASKTIRISIKDTLLPNTTYSLNFGQSIEDNNESNPFPQFKYVFSTGSHIDSLKLSGIVRDAYNQVPDPFVTVLLYEADSTYSDSIVYKNSPRYVTNTMDSATTFQFENLKAGRYKLVALKDEAGNYKFDPKTDKIGFQKAFVTVPGDTIYELELFRESIPFRAMKPVLGEANKLIMPIEGKPNGIAVALRSAGVEIPSVTTKVEGKDSLNIWFRPLKADSLDVSVTRGTYKQDFNVRIKAQKADTLSLRPKFSGTLPLRSPFVLKSTRPISTIDESLIRIRARDSSMVSSKVTYDPFTMELTLDFKREPLALYKIELLPGSITDFYGAKNDSLSFQVATKNTSDYGNLRLTLENVRQYPVIVELAKANGETVTSAYVTEPGVISFDLLDPALYTVRIIYDANGNREWDSGNYLESRQAEEVVYFPRQVDVRANWDVDQPITLP